MKREQNQILKSLMITILVFAVLLGGGFVVIDRVEKKAGNAETELVREAVRSAVLSCYAVEGAYPTELEYLKTHYGLAYDENRYLVVYDAFASNIMPDVSVLEKGVA